MRRHARHQDPPLLQTPAGVRLVLLLLLLLSLQLLPLLLL
jgi:hypothetical protein